MDDEYAVVLTNMELRKGTDLMTLRPNQIDSTLMSAFRVHSTLTAQRSTPDLSEHSCSLSSAGSMSSLLSCRYTVVPRAYASPSRKPACSIGTPSLRLLLQQPLVLVHEMLTSTCDVPPGKGCLTLPCDVSYKPTSPEPEKCGMLPVPEVAQALSAIPVS